MSDAPPLTYQACGMEKPNHAIALSPNDPGALEFLKFEFERFAVDFAQQSGVDYPPGKMHTAVRVGLTMVIVIEPEHGRNFWACMRYNLKKELTEMWGAFADGGPQCPMCGRSCSCDR
jgi:hypothetical protein